ncbi:MAG: hypothetical protein VX379_09505 [Pseudomonadota bacterium]|nr:hypothetical protein [Pseudomonadota bacterium]MEE3319806.1 hypothetical protein [Pseudomonadota bacterium]
MKVSLDEIHEAYQHSSVTDGMIEGWLNKETGQVLLLSSWDEVDPVLDDFHSNEDKYLELPHRLDIKAGKWLALDFAAAYLSDPVEEKVRGFFQKKGAFPRFKDCLEQIGMLQKWYEYEETQVLKELKQWCQLHDLDVE